MNRTIIIATLSLAFAACENSTVLYNAELTFGGVPCEPGQENAPAAFSGGWSGVEAPGYIEEDLWVTEQCDGPLEIEKEDVDRPVTVAGLNELGAICYVGNSIHFFGKDATSVGLDIAASDAACAANRACPTHVDEMGPIYQLGLELQRDSLAFCGSVFGITVAQLLLSNNVNTAAPSGNHTEAQFGLAQQIALDLNIQGRVITDPDPDPSGMLRKLLAFGVGGGLSFRQIPPLTFPAREDPAPGDYFVFAQVLKGSLPEHDPINLYQYAFVFDADGNTSNNYTPLAQYPADFFKDTDRWYELLYTPTAGWTVKVSNAHGSSITAAQSDAQIYVAGSVIFLLVPTSEFATTTPAYRFTAFRHKGDYGLQPPHDFDGYVDPPVAMGLHPFTP